MDSVLLFNHLDDDSFNLAIYELSFGPVIFDEDRLLSLKFNPLLPGNNAHSLALSSDLDPDSNFYSNASNCDYYVEHKLNEILAKEIPNNPESLSFFQLNIRSLTRNFENLTNLLANINKKFSFIGIPKHGFKVQIILLTWMVIILFTPTALVNQVVVSVCM